MPLTSSGIELLNGEIIKQAANYPDYLVTNYGRVYSKISNKFLSQSINSKGYHRVALYKDKVKSFIGVHRVVLSSFAGYSTEGREFVNHKDYDPSNNRLENLEWVTNSENQIHSLKRNLTKNQGNRSHLSVLTEDHVDAIRCLFENGFSIEKVAKVIGVSRGCVMSIKKGRSWRFYESKQGKTQGV